MRITLTNARKTLSIHRKYDLSDTVQNSGFLLEKHSHPPTHRRHGAVWKSQARDGSIWPWTPLFIIYATSYSSAQVRSSLEFYLLPSSNIGHRLLFFPSTTRTWMALIEHYVNVQRCALPCFFRDLFGARGLRATVSGFQILMTSVSTL
jgi:hypothetical protein